MRGQFPHQLGDVISIIVSGSCQQIKRRQSEALGQTRDGLDGNGRKSPSVAAFCFRRARLVFVLFVALASPRPGQSLAFRRRFRSNASRFDCRVRIASEKENPRRRPHRLLDLVFRAASGDVRSIWDFAGSFCQGLDADGERFTSARRPGLCSATGAELYRTRARRIGPTIPFWKRTDQGRNHDGIIDHRFRAHVPLGARSCRSGGNHHRCGGRDIDVEGNSDGGRGWKFALWRQPSFVDAWGGAAVAHVSSGIRALTCPSGKNPGFPGADSSILEGADGGEIECIQSARRKHRKRYGNRNASPKAKNSINKTVV
jgi:hypothetical protein